MKEQPVHRWFYFPHSFSPQLVEILLQQWKIRPGDLVLDPFVGAGTTLRVAQSLGVNGIGTDVSPLSVFISNAKLKYYDPNAIREALSKLQQELEKPANLDLSRPSRLQRAFTDAEFFVLTSIRTFIVSQPEPVRDILLLALLRIQQRVSRAIPDGGWFRWVERLSSEMSIWPMFVQFVNSLIDDIGKTQPVPGFWKAYQQDARQLEQFQEYRHQLAGGCQAIVTSPPYPNRHDYSRVFQIELLTLGMQESDIFSLRYNSLRSHVEARRPQGFLPTFKPPAQLENALEALPDANIDRRLRPMLQGYFEDINSVLRSVHNVLTAGGYAAFIVGNVRHAGVMIPVDEIIMAMAESLGFVSQITWVARLRGNSAQQMGRYGRLPARESIVILRKE